MRGDHSTLHIIGGLGIFAASVLLTDFVRRISVRVGFVYRPVAYRWNTRVVALGGGISIATIVILSIFLFSPLAVVPFVPPLLMLFILGFVDDIRNVSPLGKLLVQGIAAIWMIAHGFVLPFPEIPYAVNALLTLLWIVGLTNAVNMIDNMDGLAAGTTVLSCLGLFVWFDASPATVDLSFISLATALAAMGFLVHNFYPARIFMGDAGSLILGFLLATLTTRLKLAAPQMSSGAALWGCTAMFVLVPLFDMAVVCISRKTTGRPIMCGGKDHTSHRLVFLGRSERIAVCLLYSMALSGVIAAFLIAGLESSIALFMVVSSAAVTSAYLIVLLQMPVYSLYRTELPPSLDPSRLKDSVPAFVLRCLEGIHHSLSKIVIVLFAYNQTGSSDVLIKLALTRSAWAVTRDYLMRKKSNPSLFLTYLTPVAICPLGTLIYFACSGSPGKFGDLVDNFLVDLALTGALFFLTDEKHGILSKLGEMAHRGKLTTPLVKQIVRPS